MSAYSLFLVVKPRLWAIRNKWRRRESIKTEWIRNSVVIFLTGLIIVGSFFATLWVLEQTHTQLDFAYLHPRMFLGLILVFLFGMLVLTNVAAALGSLFMARDLGLVLASPLPPSRFFFGKWLEVMISSSWMTMVFLMPVIAAFGVFFEGGLNYTRIVIMALIPFFAIPAFVAIIVATLVAVLIPANRKRELLIILGIIAAFGLYWFTKLAVFTINDGTPIDFGDILRVVSFLSLTNVSWSPSHWVANSLGEALEPGGVPWRSYLVLLYAVMCFFMAASYVIVRLMHFSGYSRAALGKKSSKLNSKRSHALYTALLSRLSEPSRALVIKEIKTAARDITQSVQCVLLLGLCALYVYLLNFQHLFEQALPFGEERWWRMFLIITNICLEAFVITAMATRLVFPSISREGQAYWSLQSSPLAISSLLRIKFTTWLVPIVLVTTIVFGASSWILYGSVGITSVKIIFNIIQCVGLLGMGIAFGCYFVNFDWEHPSELMASFGSMIYMLSAVALIIVNLTLSGVVVGLFMPFMREPSLERMWFIVGSSAAAIFLVGLNLFIAKYSLRQGARFLER